MAAGASAARAARVARGAGAAGRRTRDAGARGLAARHDPTHERRDAQPARAHGAVTHPDARARQRTACPRYRCDGAQWGAQERAALPSVLPVLQKVNAGMAGKWMCSAGNGRMAAGLSGVQHWLLQV